MARKRTKAIATRPYDSAEYLDSDEAVSAYIEDALESDDPTFIAHALGTVARARGMAKVAKKAGLSRESLYKALGPDGNPEFGTVIRVLRALGLKFSVTAAAAQ
jgi:probable addiction module antidote protein